MVDRPKQGQDRRRGQSKERTAVRKGHPQGAVIPKGMPIEGIAAIREYLKFRPEILREIWVSPEGASQYKVIAEEIQKLGIKVCEGDRDIVAQQWGLPNIYGPIVALGHFRLLGEAEGLSRLAQLGRDREVVLVLDRIQDPRNLGAIIRTAAFFDVRHIFIPERRQVSLTPAVVATAQGGLAIADLTVVTNLSRLIRSLKELGYWVVAADMDGKPIDQTVRQLDRMVLLLGSEGDGVSQQLLNQSDIIVGQASLSGLESLNVSVAAGILLSQLLNT